MRSRTIVPAVLSVLAALALAGCGGDDEGGGDGNGGSTLSGRIEVDGSSTVAPLATLAAERFGGENQDVKVTVGVSGTGGGFERFCAGETDISDASRPIKDEEAAACKQKGIDYTELQVANDALTVVVNAGNDWATCLTTDQLKAIWEPGSKVKTWKDVDAAFPDEGLELYGPGTDSGTFDYFTGEINGEEGASRSDYSASEDDNVIVQGVSGNEGALGYFGFSYYDQNRDKLKALEIDGGDGCVAPSLETAQDGTYRPLSRPLFMYVKTESVGRPAVKAFVEYLLENSDSLARDALYVPLTSKQKQQSLSDLDAAASGGG